MEKTSTGNMKFIDIEQEHSKAKSPLDKFLEDKEV